MAPVLGLAAFGWGILSAVSLPLGAAMGLWLRPGRKVSSCLMAFGAGALLFALTIELFAHVPHHTDIHGMPAALAAVFGAIVGGLIFDGMNRALNHKGAYLRRLSHARKYVARLKLLRARKLVEELASMRLLSQIEPDRMADLVQRVAMVEFPAGATIFHQGDPAREIYFIISGEVGIRRRSAYGGPPRDFTLRAHDTFGELGVLRDAPRSADATARTDVRLYKIRKSDVEYLVTHSPRLEEAMKNLASTHIDELARNGVAIPGKAWKQETFSHLKQWTHAVSVEEIKAEGAQVPLGGAALAIWLGILIDGIPESLVIGMLSADAAGMSIAFVVGVFLANFPEAMGSAVSMRHNGLGMGVILAMWGSICLMTGLGAILGATVFPAQPEGALFLAVLAIEGLAAGAMLTMIAESMLPEAFEQGGSVVGLSTLAGFLTTLLVKVA